MRCDNVNKLTTARRSIAKLNVEQGQMKRLIFYLGQQLRTERCRYRSLCVKNKEQEKNIINLRNQIAKLNNIPQVIENNKKDVQDQFVCKINLNTYEILSDPYSDSSMICLRQIGSNRRGKWYIHVPQGSNKKCMSLSTWSIKHKVDMLAKFLEKLNSDTLSMHTSTILADFLKRHPDVSKTLAESKAIDITGKLNDSNTADIIKRLKLTWYQYVLLKRFLKNEGVNIFPSTAAVYSEIKSRNIKSTYLFRTFELIDEKTGEKLLIPAVFIKSLIDFVTECWENLLIRDQFIDRPEFKNNIYIGNIRFVRKFIVLNLSK